MSNGAIHYSAQVYGTKTACGRDIKRVPCWDDYDAVTCKTCRKIHDKATADQLEPCAGSWCGITEPHDIGASVDCRKAGAQHSRLEDEATTEVDDEPACTASSRSGLICQLGAHDDDVHQAHDPETGSTRGWVGDKSQSATNRGRHLQDLARKLSGVTYQPLQQLDDVTSVLEQAELHRAELVDQARAQGESWTKIGQAIGLTKQAAQQRYGRKAAPAVDADQLTIDV